MCPFCKCDPYEYVDIGIGYQAVAVNCCEYGHLHIVDGWSVRKIKWLIAWHKILYVVYIPSRIWRKVRMWWKFRDNPEIPF